MKKHEITMILSGVLLLFSLPFIGDFGFNFWVIAKILYFAGLILMFKQK